MSETYPGQMLPELQEKTTVDSNDLFYMVSSNASKKIKGSNLKAQMKPSDYTGATSSTNGANGLVPQPTTSDVDRFLKGDGTWGDISYAVGEASGSIASFSDGSELPMRSLKAHIEPVQDLHGYDAPWVGGAGKNKLPINSLSISGGGITAIIDRDSNNNVVSVTVNGTASGTVYVILNTFTLPSGTYTMSGCPSNGGTDSYRLYDDKHTSWADNGSGASFTLSEASQVAPTIRIANGYTVNNLKFYPMIESGSEKTTFAPYSNICPIIGWDECKVTRCGENLFDKATITENKIINSTTGEEIAFYGRFSSDYIKVNPSTDYYASNVIRAVQWYCVFYYDKNKNYLSCGELPSTGDTASGVVTTPSGCNYVRLVGVTTYKDDVSFVVGNQPPTTYEPYNGHTYTIQFTDGSNPLTVYGGYVDIVSGVLTVTWIRRNMGSLTYAKSPSGLFQTSFGDIKKPPTNTQPTGWVISSIYKEIDARSIIGPQGSNPSPDGVMAENEAGQMYFNNLAYTEVTDFKSAMDGVDLVYKLATPQTYQLTPTQVKSLLDENRVWADTGDVDVHYVRDLTITIDDILSRLEALEG